VSHLLAKAFDCSLDVSLLSVNIQRAIVFLSMIGQSVDSTDEKVKFFKVIIFHPKVSRNLLFKFCSWFVKLEQMSLAVPVYVCHNSFLRADKTDELV